MRGTKEKKIFLGWSTEEMKDKPSSSLEEDTGEMMEWRSMSQDEVDQCWKKLAGKMEEEVLDKYNVDDSKRGAYRGRRRKLDQKEGWMPKIDGGLLSCWRRTAKSVAQTGRGRNHANMIFWLEK